MEIILGIALSLIISGGKRLGLSRKESIQFAILSGSIIFAILSHYADSNLDIAKYFKDIAIIIGSTIATYELVTKKISVVKF